MNRSIVKYHIQNKMILRVERNIGTEQYIEGFPISLSQRFLLMTVINDFHDEGYAIIKVKDIKRVYSKESITFYEEMCKNEGLDKKAIPVISSLSCEKTILSELKNYNGFVEIECEQENGDEEFYLGVIKENLNEKVKMRTFDVTGKWSEADESIMYDKITKIAFGDNYSKTYYKYMSKRGHGKHR